MSALDGTAFDVIVVGGGPAGLSAALWLGRCRRRVLLCDAGRPRNAAARRIHGFLTRDGVRPRQLLELGLAELGRYGVRVSRRRVAAARLAEGAAGTRFSLRLDDRAVVTCRKLILATGVSDRLPPVAGAADLLGDGLHHCPYCDAWEVRDRTIAVYGSTKLAVGMALGLVAWSKQVELCTDGQPLSAYSRGRLRSAGVTLCLNRLTRMERAARGVVLHFKDGQKRRCAAIFFDSDHRQASELPARLNCRINADGAVRTDRHGRASVRGVFVIGDARGGVQFAITAAADGAIVATAINKEFQREDLMNRQKSEVRGQK